jgi:hypothetical protein
VLGISVLGIGATGDGEGLAALVEANADSVGPGLNVGTAGGVEPLHAARVSAPVRAATAAGIVRLTGRAPLRLCASLDARPGTGNARAEPRLAARGDRWMADEARERREAIRQLADLRRRLAAAEDALTEALAAMKQAEGAFDTASDRFGAAERAHDAAREDRAQARRGPDPQPDGPQSLRGPGR